MNILEYILFRGNPHGQAVNLCQKNFCAYYSYLDSMETLTDEERGRLFTACLIYGKNRTGARSSGPRKTCISIV